MIDSGASHVFINSRFWEELVLTALSTTAQVANGTHAEIVGSCNAPINIENKVWVGKIFLLKHLPFDCIKGMECVRDLKAIIDVGYNKFELRDSSGVTSVPFIELAYLAEPNTPPIN